MNNSLVTKMKIFAPAHEAFEAFVDPEKIKNFWFSSSSTRWESGSTVTLNYIEYDATFDIKIVKAEADRMIVFTWGEKDKNERTVEIVFSPISSAGTTVEVDEKGFVDGQEYLMMKVMEGWVYTLACLKAYLENGITTLRSGLVI